MGKSMMDKKPLIGVCICAVVLLVLGSLSNVVGYQSVKSTAVNDSPLYSVRTQRATNQQQNILTSKYLGMEEQNLLQIPMRDSQTESLFKVIKFISKMDDKTFAQFTILCIQKAREDITLKDIKSYEILQALNLLRINPEIITDSYMKRNNHPIFTVYNWIPGCYLILYMLEVIISIVEFIYVYIFGMISAKLSCGMTCGVGSMCLGSKCLNK